MSLHNVSTGRDDNSDFFLQNNNLKSLHSHKQDSTRKAQIRASADVSSQYPRPRRAAYYSGGVSSEKKLVAIEEKIAVLRGDFEEVIVKDKQRLDNAHAIDITTGVKVLATILPTVIGSFIFLLSLKIMMSDSKFQFSIYSSMLFCMIPLLIIALRLKKSKI